MVSRTNSENIGAELPPSPGGGRGGADAITGSTALGPQHQHGKYNRVHANNMPAFLAPAEEGTVASMPRSSGGGGGPHGAHGPRPQQNMYRPNQPLMM